MPRKKNGIIEATADIVGAGAAIGIGGITLGAIGAHGGPQVQRLAATEQSGLSVLSGALPAKAGVSLLKELSKLK